MKFYTLLFLLLISSCSTLDRDIAAIAVKDEIIPPEQASTLRFDPKILTPEKDKEAYLYIEIKDQRHQFVDIDESAVGLKILPSKKSLECAVSRADKGKYYLKWKEPVGIKKLQLEVTYGKVAVTPMIQFIVPEKVDFSKSSLKILSKKLTTFHLELKLVNTDHNPLKSEFPPEITFEGVGHLSDLKQIRPGVWEFDVTISNENQILYLGAQINGQRDGRLLRLQHVEE